MIVLFRSNTSPLFSAPLATTFGAHVVIGSHGLGLLLTSLLQRMIALFLCVSPLQLSLIQLFQINGLGSDRFITLILNLPIIPTTLVVSNPGPSVSTYNYQGN